ncbi:MAG: CHAT domain-containing protein, partial [Cyclobacteriaceae bacterium]|nr:CHAT domain-containing protein [Cyclobacteriaceae bacterium HetDA_MAG_MS6]
VLRHWSQNKAVKRDQFNKMTVRKVGNQLYFFVNETLVFNRENVPFFGQVLGFQAQELTTIFVDDVKIAYIKRNDQKAPQASSKVVAKTSTRPSLPQTDGLKQYAPFTEEDPDYVKAKKAYDNGNFNLAKAESEKLLRYFPEEALIYKQAALANMQLQQYGLAYNQIELAYAIDPTNYEILVHKSLFAALLGKSNESLQYARYLGKMVNQEWYDYLAKYMQTWQTNWSATNPTGAGVMGQAISALRSSYGGNDGSYYKKVQYNIFVKSKGSGIGRPWTIRNSQGEAIDRPVQVLQGRFNAAINTIYDLGLPREMMHRVMYFLYDEALKQGYNETLADPVKWDLYDFAHDWLEARMWGEQEQGRVKNPFLFCRFTDSKYNYFLEAGEFDKALALNNSRIEMAQAQPVMRFELFNLMGDKLYLLDYLKRTSEGHPYAETLSKIEVQYSSPLHVAKAYGSLSHFYRSYDPPKGVVFAQKQVNYMEASGYLSGLSTAYNDLGNAYRLNKQQEESLKAYVKSAELTPSLGGKGINYYNIGSQLWSSGLNKEAIEMYLKAEAAMTKHLKTLDNFSRSRYYETLYKNNAFLALSYYQMGQFKASFEAIERAKSLDLALAVDKEGKPLKLEEVQAMLTPNQVMVYYSALPFSKEDGNFLIYAIAKDKLMVKALTQTDNPAAYNGLINVRKRYKSALNNVEKEVAQRELRRPSFQLESSKMNNGDFNLLSEKYRQSLKADQDFIVNEFGKAYFNAFIKPIRSTMAGKKEIIIIPDAALFYLPFEAIKDENDQYLVENYDITYIQSPTVLKSIQGRTYQNRSKSVLAMGGANFNVPNIQAQVVKSVSDVQKVRLKVFEDIGNKKKSMRQSWVNLGYGPMSYLPGTVKEVAKIKETVADADVFTGDDMSETRLKSMSQEGSLSDYKILHFATHGWVEGFVPELSGFTMTTFPDERNGEDGMIYLHEVEQLKLKADLVMLSACQTALGKEQAGKGVSGLNKSFLTAGANSTITSLWAVNDYATSILASEIYRLVFEEGKNYKKAINEVKRNFITGVYGAEMSKISFWAPFIYYGK